jgi:hypothetical protein
MLSVLMMFGVINYVSGFFILFNETQTHDVILLLSMLDYLNVNDGTG